MLPLISQASPQRLPAGQLPHIADVLVAFLRQIETLCQSLRLSQGAARKIGPWDDEEAAALTREVQRYMDFKQGARAARATVIGQVRHRTCGCQHADMSAHAAGS